ncbi:MAG: alpha-L-fucosidase, partial [Clostridium sp.]
MRVRYQKEELAAFCHFGPNTFNEIEWGEHYGNKAPSEIFTLKNDFDAETLVKTLKDAGFKKLIVTAKHHDGFCIWDSQYTDYDVAASGYKDKNGESDILAEISKACTDQNMDMGLYL